MKNLCFKSVFRLDKGNKILRLFRIIRNKGNVGDGKGYSSKTSLALMPKFFKFKKELFGFKLCIVGLRLHHKKAYGGYFI